MNIPVADLHCDLLSYLDKFPTADPWNKFEIGCNLSALTEGGVKCQVMAIYTSTEKGSTEKALNQSRLFKNLLSNCNEQLDLLKATETLKKLATSSKINLIAAIENASGFCEEDEPLENGFKKLEQIISNTGTILYIGLTHHGENRFGGGNTTKVGLKNDGRALLDYLHGKRIALDLSHTSDALAYELLEHLDKYKLDIPIIASHSNFRKVFNHPRNLPDDIAKEIIKRNGIIGINFLRAFLNPDNDQAIFDHIQHGISLGAEKNLCFGADYFYTKSHPDQSRVPFFYKEQQDAACYPAMLATLSKYLSPALKENIAYKNSINFINRIWS